MSKTQRIFSSDQTIPFGNRSIVPAMPTDCPVKSQVIDAILAAETVVEDQDDDLKPLQTTDEP